jgi:hypothetical protein
LGAWNFEAQLEAGQKGEADFMAKYPALTKKGLKECDFEMPDGRWVELKTDSRTAAETGNLFIEVYSSLRANSPGGPWQAYGKGATFFVYRFSCGTEFWFDCERLMDFMEKNENSFEARTIRNANWDAAGLIVPIAAIQHLAVLAPLESAT